MDEELIEQRLESKLAAAEHSLLLRFREVKAKAAAKGALQSSSRILLMIEALGDEIDDLARIGLGDVASIERAGGDSNLLYETLRSKLIQLRLRGEGHIAEVTEWAGPAANQRVAAQVQERLAPALLRVKQHQQGFDRDLPLSTITTYSISGSPGAVQQLGSPGASAVVTVNVSAIEDAVRQVEKAAIGLDEDVASDVRAELATVRAQLAKKSPTSLIIRESAKSIRSIGENLIAGAMQPGFMLAAHALVAAVS